MNDRYLIASYFAMAFVGACIGAVAYLVLRPPFRDITAGLHRKLRILLSTLFPLGIVFPALLGFFSVSYFGCSHQEYKNIIQDRVFLIQKTHEQASAILLSISLAIVAWDLIILVVIRFCRAAPTQ